MDLLLDLGDIYAVFIEPLAGYLPADPTRERIQILIPHGVLVDVGMYKIPVDDGPQLAFADDPAFRFIYRRGRIDDFGNQHIALPLFIDIGPDFKMAI